MARSAPPTRGPGPSPRHDLDPTSSPCPNCAPTRTLPEAAKRGEQEPIVGAIWSEHCEERNALKASP